MAHYLYVSIGMPSTRHGTIGLCRRLADAGHQITVVSHRDIRAHVEKAGLAFRGLTADKSLASRADALARPGVKALHKLPGWISQRRRLRRESIEQPELEKIVAELNPDAFLIDLECHYAFLVLSALQRPIVTISFFFSVLKEANVPPLNSSLQPGNGGEWSQRVTRAWRTVRLEHRLYLINQYLGRERLRHSLYPVDYGTRHVPDLARIARSRSVKMRDLVTFDHWLRPFMPSRTPIVSLNARELEFPGISDPRMHYAGPVIDPDRIELDAGDHSTKKWIEFRERRRDTSGAKRPLIYCSHGSFRGPDKPFFNALTATFSQRTDWDLVLGLGAKSPPPPELEALPNVLCLHWAPQLDILHSADCAVHHGGVSTVNECVFCGVPMVIYPHELDQEGNAARVSFHGLGVAGADYGWQADSLESNITQCLENRFVAAAIRTKRKALHEYDKTNKAIRLIESLTD